MQITMRSDREPALAQRREYLRTIEGGRRLAGLRKGTRGRSRRRSRQFPRTSPTAKTFPAVVLGPRGLYVSAAAVAALPWAVWRRVPTRTPKHDTQSYGTGIGSQTQAPP